MAIYIFLTIFFVLFAYFSWKKPDFAVSLIVFALPSYLIRFKIGSVPLTFLEIMILILFFAWLIKVLAKKGFSTVTFSKYKYLILLFIITASIAVLVSDNRIAAFGIWKAYFLEPILFFIVLINTIRSKRQWNLIITAIGFSALVVAILAVVQQFTGWGIPNELWRDAATRRVTSIFGYPNAVGLYLAPIAVLFFGKLLMEFSKKKKV
ncbi:hypothetical protein KKC32_04550, partial [Patescibacteria group bacterium]|nr:hypothetical protein [Patescibacteria group bacterium]